MNWVAIVTQGTIPTEDVPLNTHYFSTIQGAVNAAPECGWIMIEDGIYKEEVKVTTSNLHLRGMDRNRVILDGTGIVHEGKDANGIEVYHGQQRLDRKHDGPQLRPRKRRRRRRQRLLVEWRHRIPTKSGAHGWFGKYLTAYDTGLNGGYGIFTQNETEGEWDHIYASGFNDSGIYIGACQECKAKVNHATIEYNAVGYSGSNSGGELVIENSTLRPQLRRDRPERGKPG